MGYDSEGVQNPFTDGVKFSRISRLGQMLSIS